MKHFFTFLKEFFSKITMVKRLFLFLIISALFWTGCYEWRTIIQPETATINSYFDVFLSAQDDGNPDNDWTNEDLVDYGLFGVLLPDGWSVQDSIPYTIVCTVPANNNSGILVYSEERTQTLNDSITAPPGYYWWGAQTATEASMVNFDSLYIEPRIYTGSQEGDFFIRYTIGDIDYWDRNPADDISDPIPITLINTTGVDEVLSDANISVYPNPITSTLNIKLNNYENEIIEIQLYDLAGKMVKNAKISNTITTINADDIQSGVYILKLNNGKSSSAKKIIIN